MLIPVAEDRMLRSEEDRLLVELQPVRSEDQGRVDD